MVATLAWIRACVGMWGRVPRGVMGRAGKPKDLYIAQLRNPQNI